MMYFDFFQIICVFFEEIFFIELGRIKKQSDRSGAVALNVCLL